MFNQIRLNAGFVENKGALDQLVPFVNDTFYTFRWKIPAQLPAENLFTLANQTYTLLDFAQYLEKSARLRFRLNQQDPVPSMLTKLYEDYLENETLKLEESQLEKKYPEFRHLLREYEEGILLFEVTRQTVWDKASQDSLGLANFYKLVQGKYTWNERALTTRYTLKSSAKDLKSPTSTKQIFSIKMNRIPKSLSISHSKQKKKLTHSNPNVLLPTNQKLKSEDCLSARPK